MICYAIKDEGFIAVDGRGGAYTLKERDYKTPQAVVYVANSSGGVLAEHLTPITTRGKENEKERKEST